MNGQLDLFRDATKMLCEYGYEPQSCQSAPMNCQCCHDALLDIDYEEPEHLLQDCERRLSKWLAGKPGARRHVDEQAASNYCDSHCVWSDHDPSCPFNLSEKL